MAEVPDPFAEYRLENFSECPCPMLTGIGNRTVVGAVGSREMREIDQFALELLKMASSPDNLAHGTSASPRNDRFQNSGSIGRNRRRQIHRRVLQPCQAAFVARIPEPIAFERKAREVS
jgi:hypothetical protein